MTRRLRDDDSGLTLVELLATMAILSVIMAVITGSTIFLQRSIRQTDQRFDDLAQARLAMDATTKWLRGAVSIERMNQGQGMGDPPDRQPFDEARPSHVELITNVTTGSGTTAPQRVELQVNDRNELEETVQPGMINPGGQWRPAGAARSRVVARGVIDPAMFAYFDANGTEITADGGDLSEAQREAIRYVGVNVSVQQNPVMDVPPSQLSNRVRLPNQFFYDAEGLS